MELDVEDAGDSGFVVGGDGWDALAPPPSPPAPVDGAASFLAGSAAAAGLSDFSSAPEGFILFE